MRECGRRIRGAVAEEMGEAEAAATSKRKGLLEQELVKSIDVSRAKNVSRANKLTARRVSREEAHSPSFAVRFAMLCVPAADIQPAGRQFIHLECYLC